MFARLFRSKIALGTAAIISGVVLLGGVALGALGPTSALTPLSAQPSFDAATLAEDGRGDRAKALATILDRLVANGTITAEQKDKILAAVRDAAPAARPNAKRFLGNVLENAARAIGISAGDLKRELAGSSFARVAQAHGVSRDTLVSRLTADANAAVDAALAAGRLTAEHAQSIKAHLPELIANAVDRTWPEARPRGDRGTAGKAILADLLQSAAQAIGIDSAVLKRELPGKSVAQVAQAHGVSRDTLVASMSAAATKRIDDAVAAGKLTADQASRLKAGLAQHIGTFVDRMVPARAAKP